MPGNRRISNEVMRLLYAHSGNRCAYPDCTNPIFEDDGQLTGECCHIKAFSLGGPRYDASQTDEERNGVDNLMLMCSRHHAIVDKNVDRYTVEVLQEYKQMHEEKYSAETLRLTEEQLRYLQMSSDNFWKRIERIDQEEEDLADLKMKVEASESIEDLLEDVKYEIYAINDIIDDIISADYKLIDNIRDILVEYKIDLGEFDRQLESRGSSDFARHNWEYNNLAVPNILARLKMQYLQLAVKLLEELSRTRGEEHPMLAAYREKLVEHQKNNYYYD